MCYIAHIRDDGTIQSVEEHCLAVSEYAADEGKSIGLEKTMRLAGILHDIGKSTEAFASYIKRAHEDPLSVRRGEINHSSAGGKYAMESFCCKDAIEYLTSQMTAYTIFAHHGLLDCLDRNGCSPFFERLTPKSDIYYKEAVLNSDFLDVTKLETLFSEACSEIRAYYTDITKVAKQVNPDGYADIAFFLLGALQRTMLSILIDSDRRDTAEFMSASKLSRKNDSESINLWRKYSERLETRLNKFPVDTDIANLRAEISQLCLDFASNGDGIYKLTVPTGGGKTLASMRYALKLAQEGEAGNVKKHIFYVAPFLSILEQNAAEFKSIFDDDENILEHHSNILLESDDADTEHEMLKRYELMTDDWSSPMIFTTMVQFLSVLFAGGTQYIRRMHQLKNSVIIIDEAQSIPIKCTNMFNTMCNFLSQCCGSTIVLCTATQPPFDRGCRRMLYGDPADMIGDAKKYAKAFKRVDIINTLNLGAKLPLVETNADSKLETNRGSLTTEELTEFILDKFNKSMLIVLNTKTAVKTLSAALRAEIETGRLADVRLVELTTYMCAAHRIDVINELKNDIMKKKRVLCVSTQLIEAGVDISFECVIRSISGLDSITQAAGRCNRNGEVSLGKVYIIDYKEENTTALSDIQRAKRAMRLFMSSYNGDYLLPSAMDEYYAQYFYDSEALLDYPVGRNDNLYSMLSKNTSFLCDYEVRNGVKYLGMLPQAFKTAGEEFSVIDNGDMVGIIVPYKKAKEYIEKLKYSRSLPESRKCLRKLQRYTVNVFKNTALYKSLDERHMFTDVFQDGRLLIVSDGQYGECGLDDKLNLYVM